MGEWDLVIVFEADSEVNKGGGRMDREEMLRLFESHREAEAARDIDGILETFVPDPFLETMPLGLRSPRP